MPIEMRKYEGIAPLSRNAARALRRFMLSRDEGELIAIACEAGETCYPDACNCGPNGYEKGRVCVNPFWQAEAARTYLDANPAAPTSPA